MNATTQLEQHRLEDLLDHHEITNLVHRLAVSLDDRRFEDLRALVVEDAIVGTPGGSATGRDALVAQASRNHPADEATQHVVTNLLVDLDGDRADVRANLVVNFTAPLADASLPVPPRKYALGETYRFEVVRTAEGWRFARIEARPVWIAPVAAAFLAAARRPSTDS